MQTDGSREKRAATAASTKNETLVSPGSPERESSTAPAAKAKSNATNGARDQQDRHADAQYLGGQLLHRPAEGEDQQGDHKLDEITFHSG